MGNWKKIQPATWANDHFVISRYPGHEKYVLVDRHKGLLGIFKGTMPECREKAEALLADEAAYSEYVAAKMSGELD